MPRGRKADNHGHEFHEFYYCMVGGGYQYTDDRSYKTRQGELYFFPAGQRHSGSAGKRGRHVGQVMYLPVNYYSASRQGEAELFQVVRALEEKALAGDNLISIPAGAGSDAGRLISELSEEGERRQPGFEAAQKSLMSMLLLLILREGRIKIGDDGGIEGRDAASRIKKFCLYLNDNFHQTMNVERAMSITGLSRSHFHSAFRSVTGKTLVQYVNDLRLENVIRLLQNSFMPSAEIAKTCGFTSLSHMYYVIRKSTGKNPGLIRKAAVMRNSR